MQSSRLASYSLCTGCMACVDSCSKGALSVIENKDGFLKVVSNEARCVDCGLCVDVCSVLSNTKPLCREEKAYAVWNEVDEWRNVSASGGSFSALALSVLAKGGVVYGAAIDGFDVRHKKIDCIDELSQILGSKYQHSDMKGIHKQVLTDLKQGRLVLFGGLSCQVVGLKSFIMRFGGEKYLGNLYTVDTICGGLSTALPMRLLQKTGKYKGIVSFRDKEHGWQSKGFRYSLKMQKNNDEIEDLLLDNLVLNTFSSKLLKRSSCLDCPFTGKHRASDATIGDFWGDESFTCQHKQGLSVMITHDDNHVTQINDAPIHYEQIALTDVVRYNHNYCWTKYPHIRYFLSRKVALWALRNAHVLLAQHCMRPKTIPGIFMSIYLKINNLFCARFEKKNSYR